MIYENQQLQKICDDLPVKCNKAIDYTKNEFSLMKAGRANSKILDKVMVDYYGTMTPITQMGNVSTPEPRMLAITLWDKSAIKAAEKAILAANLGLTPSNDGTVIRLIFPELTQERRKELAKQVKKLGEECKVAVRNARRDAIEGIKKLLKDKQISEDISANAEKDVDKVVADFVKSVDVITAEKEKDIMSV
ncbi:MAG: ribosome recycling factor [Clostridia bacterium]|nr:ribosome recycling factor [Clostridiales bacterium]MBR2029708.1 ribosome recycling factor [Clostridia bacterium]MBR2303363.1 ribosome recycling factor [Clostridia bacterium]